MTSLKPTDADRVLRDWLGAPRRATHGAPPAQRQRPVPPVSAPPPAPRRPQPVGLASVARAHADAVAARLARSATYGRAPGTPWPKPSAPALTTDDVPWLVVFMVGASAVGWLLARLALDVLRYWSRHGGPHL
ncbi:MAG: hypothetical protein L3K23_10450 [Thermoplasmata archaeon]|nr:hypothetical protein [Thermoplasmata archaeon]